MKHKFAAFVVLVLVLVVSFVFAAPALAEPLKAEHQGTVADCPGGVEWHFVHNQTDATSGTITVGGQQVPNGAPFEANVLHYWVNTNSNVLPGGVADDVVGGNLILSHYTCHSNGTTTTSEDTTTTTEGETTTTDPGTTTRATKPPPGGDLPDSDSGGVGIGLLSAAFLAGSLVAIGAATLRGYVVRRRW